MIVVLSLLLLLEGLATGGRILRLVVMQEFVVYPSSVVLLLAVRGGTGLVQFAAGGMLWRGHRLGPSVAAVSWGVSAALVVFEQGLRLAPTSVFPALRWPLVLAYGLYALAAGRAALRWGRVESS